MDAAAEGGEHAQPPVPDLVAEALDDDGAVARHDARRLALLAQEDRTGGGALVEVVIRRQLGGSSSTASRENAPMAAPSSFGRPMPSPRQNGTAPGAPGAGVTITRSRVISSIRQVDAPSRKVWPGRAS